MRGTPLLIAALVLGPPAKLMAQHVPDTVLAQLRPGQVLRLRLDDGRRVQARLLGLDPGLMGVRVSDLEAPVPAARIDSLWVRGRATARGAIVGAIGIAVPSFIFWAAFCEGFYEGEGCGAWGAVAGYTLAGAGAGALLGAAIGSTIPKWRLKYARPDVAFAPTPAGFGVTVRVTFLFQCGLTSKCCCRALTFQRKS